MLEVRLFSGETCLGTATLYAADPPMGVASGPLNPNDAYLPLRSIIDAIFQNSGDWDALALKVVAIGDGSRVEGVGGISIGDFLGNEAFPPEVTVLGIDCASGLYELWFGTDPAYRAYYGT
ncbi:hypothetical protein [Rhizobium sp. LjRoot254]|uniref:hypothetical protein n=1 Tax=Rhizobium sp. LjRoot254 TaxID=3342297 RepID=UPI003ECEDC8B